MPEPVDAYIGIGSNLGDRQANVARALELIEALPQTRLERASSLMENPAVGSPVPADDFLNGVAWIRTGLSARELLEALLDIERGLGRDRDGTPRNAPRTLDLDILLYGGQVIDEPDLQVPHPRMHERDFVLWPLLQVAPKVRDPRTDEPFSTAYHKLQQDE